MSDTTSDEQPSAATETTTEPKNAWGDPIGDERKAALKALADKQREWAAMPEAMRGDSHFKDVELTGADVFWLAVLALAGPGGDVFQAEKQLRLPAENILERIKVDLSSLRLEAVNLQ